MGANQTKTHIYAVPISEKKQGETQIYRNVRGQQQLLDFPAKDIQTIQAVIEHAHLKFKDKPFVGKRDPKTNQFTYKTYSEEYRDARGVGSSIQKLYLTHNTSEYKNISVKLIGIYAKNRVEWNTVDMACALYGFTLIPMYDTLGSETISYIFEQTQLTSCFCSAASIKTILSTQNLQKLVNIISFDPIDEEIKQQIQQRGLNLMYFNDLVMQGTAHLLDLPNDVSPNTIFTFSYTSGTTGLPKGAMLSHKNFISIIPSLGEIDINENDNQLCYLPLPHVLQRMFNVVCWHTGTKIAFFGGDILKLKDDIQDSKPTLFVSVPRLFNKFYDVIQDNLKKLQGCKSSLIQSAIKTKLENLKTKNQLTHFFYDKLIFNKLKDVFGGKIRIVASGSAPISQEVLDFFKIVLQCPVYEGYGQTEGTGFQFCTSKYDMKASGYVGGVCPQLEMKLIDVPEMNYFSTDKNEKGENIPRGEICIRGNSLFPGYYKDEEKTKEAVDDQGWLHSGDIGLLLPNGSLKIIDRRKNIFKLSQGEYVAPEKVENIYIRARGVQEAFLFGDSLQNYCVAILVPNPDEIKKIAAELNVNADQDISILCQNQQIINFYQKSVFDHGKTNKLFTFEQATKVHLEPKSFILLGLCTSTLKLQRHQAKQYYKQIIDQLYSQK